jgi:hypothetical protein
MLGGCGWDTYAVGYRLVAGPCEHGNELSDSIQRSELAKQFTTHQHLKNNSFFF